jgi:hypothetical protein
LHGRGAREPYRLAASSRRYRRTVLREQPSCRAICRTPSPLRALTRISTACSWVNIDGQKTVSFAQVGQIYFGAVGQFYFGGDSWLLIEPIESSEAFRVMEDFVDQCGDDQLGRALGQALGQRKPFRQFKDALAVHPTEREAWFAFERQAMEAIARWWRGDHVIAPQWAARPNGPTP